MTYTFEKLYKQYKALDNAIKAKQNLSPKLRYIWEILHSINGFLDVLNTFEDGIRDIESLYDLFELKEKSETFASMIKSTVGAIENLEK